jgi:hypothetical protein
MGAITKGFSKGEQWLRKCASYDGDECLLWPYSRTRGYGMFVVNGQRYYATRFMCELVHGKPPSPKHEAAHSCGNGHGGCVHPKHLSWKTPSDNTRDSIEHGTHYKSRSKTPRFKLTESKVAAIKKLKGKSTQENVAAQFDIHRDTVGRIWRGQTWKTGKRTVGGFQANPWTAERRAQYGK